MSRWPKKEDEKITVPDSLKPTNEKSEPTNVQPVAEPVAESAPKEQVSPAAPQTFVVKTELDAYINERLKTQPASLADIRVDDVIEDPGSGMHALKLPKEVEDALKKRNMVPRWINKDKRMIDRALNIRKWILFNRVYFPELKKHLFTANGTIENGDSILAFMPSERAAILRSIPGKISQERIKDLPIEKYKKDQGEKIGYYKPALTAEKDGELVTTGFQPDKPNEE